MVNFRLFRGAAKTKAFIEKDELVKNQAENNLDSCTPNQIKCSRKLGEPIFVPPKSANNSKNEKPVLRSSGRTNRKCEDLAVEIDNDEDEEAFSSKMESKTGTPSKTKIVNVKSNIVKSKAATHVKSSIVKSKKTTHVKSSIVKSKTVSPVKSNVVKSKTVSSVKSNTSTPVKLKVVKSKSVTPVKIKNIAPAEITKKEKLRIVKSAKAKTISAKKIVSLKPTENVRRTRRSSRSDDVYTETTEIQASVKAPRLVKNAVKKMVRRKDARLNRVRALMQAGECVEGLPGRIEEFDWIKRTVLGLLDSSLGGSLYISGVPGTGKTATTHLTLDALTMSALRGECQDFDFCEINGMRLSDPGQAYSILAKTILGSNSSGALSLKRLEAHFKAREKNKTPGRPCIVLLDELDLLLRKRQSILYHFFEWPNWANSQLIVITIANTMDLPERFLSNRISSRLGLTRYNFKPYDHLALATIIEHQLKDYVQFLGKDAIQLCARKVSAVSGDARRAVNLAKRAIDYFRSCTQEELLERTTGRRVDKIAEGSEMTLVNLRLMDLVLRDALLANPVQVISQLSKHQRLLLLSVVLCRKKLEEEHVLKGLTRIIGGSKQSSGNPLTLNRLLEQHFQLCRTHQFHPLPSLQELYALLESVEALRLLRCGKFREAGPEATIQLLVHEEDIKKGLGDDQALKKYLRSD